MSDISFTDLASSAGQTSGNYLKDIGNAAADFACSLYKNHNSWLINKLDPTGISTGFGNGLMSSLCAPRPGSSTPPPAQSMPVVCWRFSGRGTDNAYSYDLFSAGRKPEYRVIGNNADANALAPFLDGKFIGTSPTYAYMASGATITQVSSTSERTASDFSYGTCSVGIADPPPPSSNSDPSPSELTTNTTVNNTNVPITFVDARPDTGLRINVGGVNIRFDHNGMTLNGNNQNNTATNDNSQVSNIALQVSNMSASLNSLMLAPSLPLTQTVNPTGQSGNKNTISSMRIVTITLDSVDPKASSHFGNENYNVYKAGYFRFTRQGYYYPYESIRYIRSIFVAPPGADGYTYNLYGTYTGHATEYTL